MLSPVVGTPEETCFACRVRELIPISVRRLLGGAYESWRSTVAKRRLLQSLRGDAVECNVCGWRGSRFTDDAWHPGTICPVCRSQVRHRMFVALLDGLAGDDCNGWSLVVDKDVLHFAPEIQLRERIQKIARTYVTADFDHRDCDLKLDMSSMPTVPDASFDVVIACDVLEHVPDDRAAMRELKRILRPGGTAVLTVPQKDPPSRTDEDSSITAPSEREARFGQKDHLRIFGDDFSDRLAAANFTVTAKWAKDFSLVAVSYHVLTPLTESKHPLATNWRRLYIAQSNKNP